MGFNSRFLYTAPPFQSSEPTPDEMDRKAKYDKWISKLKKIQNFYIREGRCRKVNGCFHQKGVDTLITMDLMSVLNSKKVNTIILVSCDTDFVPVLEQAQKEGLNIILFYYNDFVRKSEFSMSNHMLVACPNHVLITKEHLENSKKE